MSRGLLCILFGLARLVCVVEGLGSKSHPVLARRAACEPQIAGCTTEHSNGVSRPHIGNVPYGSIINECTIPGTVALTFDDGPNQYTSMVLDTLKSHGVKATFFVNGDNNPLGTIDDPSTPWPGLLQRMVNEGHQVASHTWSHEDLSQAAPHIRGQQMERNENAFRNVFGYFPTYMRPPYGSCSAESGCLGDLQQRGYHIINFDVDTKDYLYDDPSAIQWSKEFFADTLRHSGYNQRDSRAGHIVLTHDPHRETVVSLTPFMITTLRELGYRPVTVGECLGDPPSNWYRSAPPSALPPPQSIAPSQELHRQHEHHTGTQAAAQPSINGECGGPVGMTCHGSAFGQCCSKYGYCGITNAHCDSGCQAGFGTCW